MGSSTPPRPGSPPTEPPQPCASEAQDSAEKDALTDPLFMNEKELLIESVRNTRLTLSVEQDILAILQAQKG